MRVLPESIGRRGRRRSGASLPQPRMSKPTVQAGRTVAHLTDFHLGGTYASQTAVCSHRCARRFLQYRVGSIGRRHRFETRCGSRRARADQVRQDHSTDGQGYGGLRLDGSNWQGDQQNAFSRFQTTPDYQFRLQQGQKALDQSAAARGNLLSGKQVKASQEFGGNLASGEYNNWFNKLAGVSGQGQAAAMGENSSNLAATGMQNNALIAQGGFQQAGANALGSGIGQGFQNALSLLTYGGGGGKFGIPGWA